MREARKAVKRKREVARNETEMKRGENSCQY
jgi:hypothetical protein